MRDKRPVNKESASNQVFLRHRPPIAAVIAIVAVVAHREITVSWHDISHLRSRKKSGSGITERERNIARSRGVSMVRFLRFHHPADTKTLGQLAIHIELGRIDS